MSQPNFGWVMGHQMGIRGWTSPLLGKPPYRWVSLVLKLVETRFKEGITDPAVMIVSEADALNMNRDSPLRVLLNATLLARDATVETVAGALGLDPQLVDAYADLFFNVLDRKDEPAYLQKAVKAALSRLGMEYDFKTVDPLEFKLLHTGRGGTEPPWLTSVILNPSRDNASTSVM